MDYLSKLPKRKQEDRSTDLLLHTKRERSTSTSIHSEISETSERSRVLSEPASPTARPIYWETGSGQILGPAVPEFLQQDGRTFWIVLALEGQILWINADRLRSKKHFEQQRPVSVIEQVKEPR